jgi:hypothetical protein
MIFVLIVIACIVSSGNYMYRYEYNFEKAENQYKVPQEAIEVSDILLADSEEPRIVVGPDLYCYIRQYSTKIKMMYGRNADGYMSGGYGIMPQDIFSIRWSYNFPEMSVNWIYYVSKEGLYRYMVIPKDKILSLSELDECGYYVIGETEHYKIYRTDNM